MGRASWALTPGRLPLQFAGSLQVFPMFWKKKHSLNVPPTRSLSAGLSDTQLVGNRGAESQRHMALLLKRPEGSGWANCGCGVEEVLTFRSSPSSLTWQGSFESILPINEVFLQFSLPLDLNVIRWSCRADLKLNYWLIWTWTFVLGKGFQTIGRLSVY